MELSSDESCCSTGNNQARDQSGITQLDFNGHINNGSYLIWALETLPENLQPGPAPRRIRINFKRETFAGAPISIEHRLAGLQTQHSIVSDGELRAEIVIDWLAE